jgi:hypothetical protein
MRKRCKHCNKRSGIKGSLCSICAKYSKCIDCQIIMGERNAKQYQDTKLCTECYEDRDKT